MILASNNEGGEMYVQVIKIISCQDGTIEEQFIRKLFEPEIFFKQKTDFRQFTIYTTTCDLRGSKLCSYLQKLLKYIEIN